MDLAEALLTPKSSSNEAEKAVITYRQAIFQMMQEALSKHAHVVILGQGVNDPVGIFGTTLNLYQQFGKSRVIDMPIAEEGMTGMALGMSVNGLYPIQTHIRADFLLVAMNQIVNMVAKYRYMYGGAFELPMLIRVIIGRSWGQGPQHSQSLQSIFAHIPGLTVLMPSSARAIKESYQYVIEKYKAPVISFEHRLLYDYSFPVDVVDNHVEPLGAKILQTGKDITIVAVSYMVQESQKAAAWVKKYADIECEIIDLHNISHVDHALIIKSLQKTRRLIVVDTGWSQYGIVAEICRGIMTRDSQLLISPVVQLGMCQTPCPTSHVLENYFYPDMADLVTSIYKVIYGSDSHLKPVPTQEFIRLQKKTFKGPF